MKKAMKGMNKRKMNKKGQGINSLTNGFFALMFMAVAIVVVVVINTFGADFVTDQQSAYVTGAAGCNSTDVSSCGAAYNISVAGLDAQLALGEGTEDVTDVGIITIVLALLIGLVTLFGVMGFRR